MIYNLLWDLCNDLQSDSLNPTDLSKGRQLLAKAQTRAPMWLHVSGARHTLVTVEVAGQGGLWRRHTATAAQLQRARNPL